MRKLKVKKSIYFLVHCMCIGKVFISLLLVVILLSLNTGVFSIFAAIYFSFFSCSMKNKFVISL